MINLLTTKERILFCLAKEKGFIDFYDCARVYKSPQSRKRSLQRLCEFGLVKIDSQNSNRFIFIRKEKEKNERIAMPLTEIAQIEDMEGK